MIGNLLYELLTESRIMYQKILSEERLHSFFRIFYHILHLAIFEDDTISLPQRELIIIRESLSYKSAK